MSRPRSTATRSTDPSPAGRFRLAAVAAVLALLLGVAGCGGDDHGGQVVGGDSRISAADAMSQEQQLLNQRARAIRTHDLGLFLRRVDHHDKALMARQRQYFGNLVQLPLARFGYRVTSEQWEGVSTRKRWGSDLRIPRIVLSMQLLDFDAVPVQRTVGFVFSFANGRATIVSDRTGTGKMLYAGTPAPWDLTAITAREEPGVLGIFDKSTKVYAATVTDTVRQGIADLNRALPFTWSDRVVVYSVQDPHVLATFRDVPGGAIDHLGAMTFPTYSDAKQSQVASTRMLLMPSSVRAGSVFLGRITRHELSHVAIGVRDDGSPSWVSEGIAEYLGARDVPQHERIIPTAALQRAQDAYEGMPVSKTFNDSDQEWHYALAWMACDYIASTFGESRLWELIDAMHNGGDGTSDQDQDRVLEQVLGFDSHELARRAAARIRRIYG